VVDARWQDGKEDTKDPFVIFNGLSGVKCASDGLCPILVIDNNPQVEWYVILVSHECDVVNHNIPEVVSPFTLTWQHERANGTDSCLTSGNYLPKTS